MTLPPVPVILLVIFVAIAVRQFATAPPEDLLDLAVFSPVAPPSERHIRSSAAALTFASQAPVDFDVTGVHQWAKVFVDRQVAVVIRGSVAATWPALVRWNASNHVGNAFKDEGLAFFSVHAPFGSHVRMHSTHRDIKLAAVAGVNWTRPWREARMRIDDLFAAKHCAYLLLNMLHAPAALQNDVNVVDFFLPHSPPHQINAWLSAPTVTTPLHYDLMDNFYAQVAGRKRFLLFPPSAHWSARIHSTLHPSSRQSHLDLENETQLAQYPELMAELRASATEVVLEPGDVLFIPALWLHHVTTVGDELSMSISTHSDTRVARLREVLLIASDHALERHVAPHRAQLHGDAALAVRAFRAFADAFVGADSPVPALCAASRWNESAWRDEDALSTNLLALRLAAEDRLRASAAPAELSEPLRSAVTAFGAALRTEVERDPTAVSAIARAITECDVLELAASELLGAANVLLTGTTLDQK